MTVRGALGGAFLDFWRNSWRLVPANAVIGFALLGIVTAAVYAPAALVLLVLLGPPAAALMHAAVTLAEEENVALRDAVIGLRLHWRRGLALGAVNAAVAVGGVFAAAFYFRHGVWPLAFAVVYVLFMVGVHQLLLWPLAIAEPELPLRLAAVRAAQLLLRRPAASLGLGLALLLVNAAAVAAATMPFLTLTIAYTCLAAVRFVLPRPPSIPGGAS